LLNVAFSTNKQQHRKKYVNAAFETWSKLFFNVEERRHFKRWYVISFSIKYTYVSVTQNWNHYSSRSFYKGIINSKIEQPYTRFIFFHAVQLNYYEILHNTLCCLISRFFSLFYFCCVNYRNKGSIIAYFECSWNEKLINLCKLLHELFAWLWNRIIY
jgi:hypothetical protein